ncbi:unnamed protein product [Amoebophrya sp. A120]|nr:unnamed protein product [Amoebophrya sp. A120]|eukprot:GSA120T00018429001.1
MHDRGLSTSKDKNKKMMAQSTQIAHSSERNEASKLSFREWVHVTRSDNLAKIRRDKELRLCGSVNQDADGVLSHAMAPRGVWFFANSEPKSESATNEGRETVAPTPEEDEESKTATDADHSKKMQINKTESTPKTMFGVANQPAVAAAPEQLSANADSVFGIAEDVRVLLPSIDDYDGRTRSWKTLMWTLFQVADVFEYGCRQVKYAIVVESSPEYYWFMSRCLPDQDLSVSYVLSASNCSGDNRPSNEKNRQEWKASFDAARKNHRANRTSSQEEEGLQTMLKPGESATSSSSRSSSGSVSVEHCKLLKRKVVLQDENNHQNAGAGRNTGIQEDEFVCFRQHDARAPAVSSSISAGAGAAAAAAYTQQPSFAVEEHDPRPLFSDRRLSLGWDHPSKSSRASAASASPGLLTTVENLPVSGVTEELQQEAHSTAGAPGNYQHDQQHPLELPVGRGPAYEPGRDSPKSGLVMSSSGRVLDFDMGDTEFDQLSSSPPTGGHPNSKLTPIRAFDDEGRPRVSKYSELADVDEELMAVEDHDFSSTAGGIMPPISQEKARMSQLLQGSGRTPGSSGATEGTPSAQRKPPEDFHLLFGDEVKLPSSSTSNSNLQKSLPIATSPNRISTTRGQNDLANAGKAISEAADGDGKTSNSEAAASATEDQQPGLAKVETTLQPFLSACATDEEVAESVARRGSAAAMASAKTIPEPEQEATDVVLTRGPGTHVGNKLADSTTSMAQWTSPQKAAAAEAAETGGSGKNRSNNAGPVPAQPQPSAEQAVSWAAVSAEESNTLVSVFVIPPHGCCITFAPTSEDQVFPLSAKGINYDTDTAQSSGVPANEGQRQHPLANAFFAPKQRVTPSPGINGLNGSKPSEKAKSPGGNASSAAHQTPPTEEVEVEVQKMSDKRRENSGIVQLYRHKMSLVRFRLWAEKRRARLGRSSEKKYDRTPTAGMRMAVASSLSCPLYSVRLLLFVLCFRDILIRRLDVRCLLCP